MCNEGSDLSIREVAPNKAAKMSNRYWKRMQSYPSSKFLLYYNSSIVGFGSTLGNVEGLDDSIFISPRLQVIVRVGSSEI